MNPRLSAEPVDPLKAYAHKAKERHKALKEVYSTAHELGMNKGEWDPRVHQNLKAAYLEAVEKYAPKATDVSELTEAKHLTDTVETTAPLKSPPFVGRAFAVGGIGIAVTGLAIAVRDRDWKGAAEALANLGSGFKDIAQEFERIPGATEFLERVGGVSGIVTGLMVAAKTIKECEDKGLDLSRGLELASASLQVVSSGCLLLAPTFPPLAGVAAVTGIASGALGVASYAAGHEAALASDVKQAGTWIEAKGDELFQSYGKAVEQVSQQYQAMAFAGVP